MDRQFYIPLITVKYCCGIGNAEERGIFMPYLFRRIGEIFGFEFIISMIVSVLGAVHIIPSTAFMGSILAFAQIVLNFAFQFFCLRAYLRRFKKMPGIYYSTNLFATMIFTMVAALLALLDIEPLYAYLFMPMKFFYYAAGMDKFLSAIAVGLIFAAEVPVVFAVVSMIDRKRYFTAK